MKEIKKITVSAMMCALAVAILAVGAWIETMDLTIAAVASLTVAFLWIEVGSPYTWLSWIATSLLAWLLFPHSAVFAEYLLVFGLYPILKGYIERLPRACWLILKILFFNLAYAALFFLMEKVLGIPFLEEGETTFLLIAFIVLLNVASIAYDFFLTVVTRLYFLRFRDKFKRYL